MAKTWYEVNVYLLTDKNGEWWETAMSNGSTPMYRLPKEHCKMFKTQADAVKWAKKRYNRFQILELTTPVSPSIEYGQTVVFSSALEDSCCG